MQLIPLTDFNSQLSQNALQFLVKNEEKCVSLMSRFLLWDAEFFCVIDNSNRISGVISFSKGGQLLHCLYIPQNPQEKSELSSLLAEFFTASQFKKLFSIIGLAEGVDFISKIAGKTLGISPRHENSYDLLIWKKPSQNFQNSEAIQATLEDFEQIFPLQKEYELEEVVINKKDFNEQASRIQLRKKIQNGQVYFLKNDSALIEPSRNHRTETDSMEVSRASTTAQNRSSTTADSIVSKLSINAEGKNFIQIGGMFTRTEFRNRGFGEKLLLPVCKKYSENGKKIVLFVKKDNPSAQRLYEKSGFQKIYDYKILYY
ncbi:MAG: GNAT family N-acetyltransferase [Treponema sp.]|nr:GNAT family N-acetyltransferase [Candidatus Treponema equifaecale]